MLRKLKRAIKKCYRTFSFIIPDVYLPYPSSGGKIYLNLKESPSMFSRALGRYEVLKKKAVLSLLKPGEIFVDVGANMGDFTLLAAKIVGSEGKVISIEPEPNNVNWIGKSVQLNGYPNVILLDIALGEKDSMEQLYLSKTSGWHSLIPSLPDRDKGVIEVNVRALDNVMTDIKQKKIDMIKIDVEGAELQALKGGYKTLTENKDIIVLIDIHPALRVDPKAVAKLLTDIGFNLYQMAPPFNIPLKVNDQTTEILAYRNGNLIS